MMQKRNLKELRLHLPKFKDLTKKVNVVVNPGDPLKAQAIKKPMQQTTFK